MEKFTYETEGDHPIDLMDLYKFFNDYRTWKHIMEMLAKLNKTKLSDYRILEPGCGGGSKLRVLTEFRAKPARCFGFDRSKKAIAVSKSMSPSRMNFQVASVMEMPYKDKTFELILCSGLLNSFKETNDIKQISKELRRVIKNNGALLVIEITEHFRDFHLNELADRFKFFDTTKNELENILSDEFTAFKRTNLFAGGHYYLNNNRWANLYDLPSIDKALDTGELPSSYCLYSFLPK